MQAPAPDSLEFIFPPRGEPAHDRSPTRAERPSVEAPPPAAADAVIPVDTAVEAPPAMPSEAPRASGSPHDDNTHVDDVAEAADTSQDTIVSGAASVSSPTAAS